MTWMWSTVDIADALRIGIALVFATAGIAKLAAFRRFVIRLRHQALVPAGWERLVAGLLASSETVVALLLAIRVFETAALIVAACLVAVFAAVQVVLLRRGAVVPCLCFGPSSNEPVSARSVARLVVLAAAVVALFSGWTSDAAVPEAEDLSTRLVAATNALVLALVGLGVGAVALTVPELLKLQKRCAACQSSWSNS